MCIPVRSGACTSNQRFCALRRSWGLSPAAVTCVTTGLPERPSQQSTCASRKSRVRAYVNERTTCTCARAAACSSLATEGYLHVSKLLQELTPIHVVGAQARELITHNVCSGERRSNAVQNAQCKQREFECHRCTCVVTAAAKVVREWCHQIICCGSFSSGKYSVV
eukprot:1906284-Prymnesium_polylepis.2